MRSTVVPAPKSIHNTLDRNTSSTLDRHLHSQTTLNSSYPIQTLVLPNNSTSRKTTSLTKKVKNLLTAATVITLLILILQNEQTIVQIGPGFFHG